ncbi:MULTISPECIES: hypothetical protein [Dietzia]|nr:MULTISPECIES: hypothetical protein [Dietzia]MCT1522075.1 hypothetical protein [Dietzia maris]
MTRNTLECCHQTKVGVRMSIAVSDPVHTAAGVSYTAEVQLAEPVRAWLNAQDGIVAVGDEIDAGRGVADLVAGFSGDAWLPTRSTFANPLALSVLDKTQVPIVESQLRAWAPHGWRSLKRQIIEPLVAGGHLEAFYSEEESAPSYRATLNAADPFSSLVAVELKLKDWRRAVAQAGRYRLFAERSFVAMPVTVMSANLETEALRNRVGLLSIDSAGGVEVVLEAPTSGPLQPLRRRWAAEQLLSAVRAPTTRVAGSPIL